MNYFLNLITSAKVISIGIGFCLILVGYFAAKRLSNLIERSFRERFSRHHLSLLRSAVFYLTFVIFAIFGLQQMGFNLSVLLGAAGVFTVALSFASQTAASNLISGIFMLFEQPFKMGDNIEVKGISGIVESIGLLSTKLKTSDNKLIRIPNEALMKSEITNLSYFQTRRIDLIVGVAYSNDIDTIKQILLTAAHGCKKALQEPAPAVAIHSFTNSAVELKFMVWSSTKNLSQVQNYLQEHIKQGFDKEHIAMPISQMTIHRVDKSENPA